MVDHERFYVPELQYFGDKAKKYYIQTFHTDKIILIKIELNVKSLS